MSLVGPRPSLPYELEQYQELAQTPPGGPARYYWLLAGAWSQPGEL